MRKVANLSEMSLSNVQYYFKTKNDLLIAVADRYFAKGLTEMREMAVVKTEDELTDFVRAFLQHGLEISEMCRIFREYWAISTRNQAIKEYLDSYYQSYFSVVSEKLSPLTRSESNLSNAVAIFLSTTEGYSVTAPSIPVDYETVVSVLHRVTLDSLTNE